MSNALALAAITAALKDLLEEAVPEASDVGGAVEVTAKAPDLISTDANDTRQLNLFLYQVTPNVGWVNVGLPTRDANGERTANPPLALDLHYLLTAYASASFQAEIILGCAMQCLHELSVFPRDKLREMQNKWRTDTDALRRALARSDLADQAEQIKVSPDIMSTEEISKLWAAFQTNYRPTAAYVVSVALIESALPARSPLPVLARGAEDRGATAPPDLTPPFPTLVAATPPNQQISVRLGDVLTLSGFQLEGEAGDDVEVRARHARMLAPAPLRLKGAPTATEMCVQIPKRPDTLPAGDYILSVGYSRNGRIYRSTNDLPFSLVPAIKKKTAERDKNGRVTVAVWIKPYAWLGQRVSFFLNDREAIAQPFESKKAAALTFVFERVPAGEYWGRLRVDGVESLLVNRAVTPPVFDETQRVAIP